MRRKTYFSALLALALVMSACTYDSLNNVGGYSPQGKPVDVSLNLTVGDLNLDVSTKGEDAEEIEDTEAERRVNDIWVFQYNANGINLITNPVYIKITEQTMLTDIPLKLSDNNGESCIVYVVANMGSDTWGSSTTEFGTLDGLKKHTIYGTSAGPFRIDGTGGETETALSIPMGGSAGEDENLVISSGSRITVPVRRMLAKLYVHVSILRSGEGTEDINASLTSFYIEHIASESTVETIYEGDGSWYYPQSTRFNVSRYFSAADYPGTEDESGITYGPFVLYVSENIQGAVGEGNTVAPANALRLTTGINATIDEGGVSYSPSYVACPGSWDATLNNQEYGENFNIERNTIYDIQVNISVREDDLVTPSANCIIAPPGQTTAFYPYVRDEEPSDDMKDESNWDSELAARYDFTTYLDPSAEDKVIRGLKIIWQTQGCIGDNSGYNLVWMDDMPSGDMSEDARASAERHRKIYVSPQKVGNALIAAYNDSTCTGDILWSWHIWATDLPIEEDAIEYYHYNWDSNGINTDSFVAGPLVMMCSLGALAERPTTSGVFDTGTYGMLYQWGRKDPFPPIKTTNKGTNGQATKGGIIFYDYADYDLYISGARDYTIEVGVYDNSNRQIVLTGNDGSINATANTDVFYTKAASSVPSGDLGYTDNDVILQSVRHPTMFISATNLTFSSNGTGTGQSNNIGSYYNSGDWLPDNDDFLWGGGHPGEGELQVYSQSNSTADEYGNTYKIDAYLENDFGPNKQIFDPCPYGWRVSSGEIWLGFTYDGLNWGRNGNDYSEIWSKINCADAGMPTVNSQNGFTFYMQGWHQGVTSFFPTQPARSPSGQPYLIGGICGNYHNATVDREYHLSSWGEGVTIRRVDILHLHAESDTYGLVKPFTNELYYYTKAVAGPLRCVRDTK